MNAVVQAVAAGANVLVSGSFVFGHHRGVQEGVRAVKNAGVAAFYDRCLFDLTGA